MATSCALFDPAKGRAVRVNWDGYPERMLYLLNQNWTQADFKNWESLFSGGEICSLGTDIGNTEWYGNDQQFFASCGSSLFENASVDYVYKYCYGDDSWQLI